MAKHTDHSQLVDHLSHLEPGFLPGDVFDAVARLVVTPTVVLIPLFRRDSKTRVVLTRREPDDVHYAGQLHPPGKIMLATDSDLEAVFRRLLETELQGLKTQSSPVFVAPFLSRSCVGAKYLWCIIQRSWIRGMSTPALCARICPQM